METTTYNYNDLNGIKIINRFNFDFVNSFYRTLYGYLKSLKGNTISINNEIIINKDYFVFKDSYDNLYAFKKMTINDLGIILYGYKILSNGKLELSLSKIDTFNYSKSQLIDIVQYIEDILIEND